LNSRELIKLLETNGWELVRIKGSHHQFKHPTNPKLITAPSPRKDLGTGLVKQIKKDAGLE
jgi:predicted RNA binding protein YcfA (HicA-like mRNA interferase family)